MDEMEVLFLLLGQFIMLVDCQIQNIYRLNYTDVEPGALVNGSLQVSEIDCARRCHQTFRCYSFQYNRDNGLCVTSVEQLRNNTWEVEASGHPGNNEIYTTNPGGGLKSQCTSHYDCDVVDSICHEGECKCTPGYSVNQSTNGCVRRCAEYGPTMTMYQGLGIAAYNEEFLYNVTREECIHACVNENSYICLSVDYDFVDYQCNLQERGYLDVSPTYRESGLSDWDLGSRDCAP